MLDPRPLGTAHRHGLDDDLLARTFDVCVIGSGASGAVAADALVRGGLDVLMVEQGGRLAPTTSNAELDAACETARARNAAGEWTDKGWPWTTRNLGGGTIFYGGASFRYRAFDFDPTARIHVDELDLRWPFRLDALTPYYAAIERRLGVCTHPMSLPGERIAAGARLRGYSPIATPLAINNGASDGRPACDRQSLCISHQCAIGAKADVVRVFLDPIRDRPNFTLRTGVQAVALTQSSAARADGVECLDPVSGRRRRVAARAFVLACNAIQTAGLLLRSQTSFQPDGLGNDHDLVGRGLCMKLSEYAFGEIEVAPEIIDDHPIGYGGPFSTVSILDHYLDDACPTGVGGLIYEAKPDDPRVFRRGRLLLRVETILSDHPSLRNRVRLADTRDAWGVPKLVIDYRTDPRDAARLEYMVGRAQALLAASGASGLGREASNYMLGSTHLHGTCRAGDDPRRSVVDRWSRVHSVDNVFVADGSFMPYPGGLNPTLTIQAHALRTADRILAEWASPVHAADRTTVREVDA